MGHDLTKLRAAAEIGLLERSLAPMLDALLELAIEHDEENAPPRGEMSAEWRGACAGMLIVLDELDRLRAAIGFTNMDLLGLIRRNDAALNGEPWGETTVEVTEPDPGQDLLEALRRAITVAAIDLLERGRTALEVVTGIAGLMNALGCEDVDTRLEENPDVPGQAMIRATFGHRYFGNRVELLMAIDGAALPERLS